MMNYRETDPEFSQRMEHFAFEEVVNQEGQQLDEVTRHLAILATLMGCQGKELFAWELGQALDAGITPVMAKEVVYQAVDYLGMGRALPFLDITHQVLTQRGVTLPLEGQATTTMENRLEKGYQTQAEIFGGQMLEAWKQSHINYWPRQLLRGLLHPHRFGPETAGADYLLLFGCPGWLRTSADQSRERESEFGQRQGLFDPGRIPVPALHRLSQKPQCNQLYQQSGGRLIRLPMP